MYIVFSSLIILASIFLILAVLIQNSKGGGLAANFASSNQTFGVRQTADILEKATWYLTIAIFVFCFAATASIPSGGIQNGNNSAVQKELQNVVPNMPQDFPVTGNAPVEQLQGDSVQ